MWHHIGHSLRISVGYHFRRQTFSQWVNVCHAPFAASTDHETMNESIEGAEAKPWEKRNRHDVSCKPTRAACSWELLNVSLEFIQSGSFFL